MQSTDARQKVETEHGGEVLEQIQRLIEKNRGETGALIRILGQIQGLIGYLTLEVMEFVSHELRVPLSEVYGVASFYAQFRFERQGEHIIKVCEGTACHVGGSARILEEVERELGIQPGGTTSDYKFSLERVACVGCCALAPVMIVDDTVNAKITIEKAKKILAEY